jgi:hypothetical protein
LEWLDKKELKKITKLFLKNKSMSVMKSKKKISKKTDVDLR